VTPTLLIRPLTAKDLPALEWEGAFTHQRLVFERTFAETQRGTKQMLVAEAAGLIIGQIFIQFRSSEPQFADGSTRGYLFSLRVRLEWRGHGVGTALIAAAEAELQTRGYGVAVISSAKDNPGAQRLYERLGYRVFSEDDGEWYFTDVNGQTQHIQEPCWVMEKAISGQALAISHQPSVVSHQ
jgi:ribosomal protein S18 acetylase RimI-like enzyme